MTTRQRSQAVAAALAQLPGWPETSADDLLAPVTAELGHPEILDSFQQLGTTRSHAIPVSPLLHILTAAAPASGVRSLARGLVLGTKNLVSSPQTPLLTAFLSALPDRLRSRVDHQTELPPQWLRSASGIIAFGSDNELSAIRNDLRTDRPIELHPPSVSFAIVFGDSDLSSPPLAAHDIASSMALGESLVHDIFLAHSAATPARYAKRLAAALDLLPTSSAPPPPAAVSDLRSSYTFRAATDPTVSVHGQQSPAGHTIIAESDPLFATAPAPGVVFVKPLPDTLANSLRFVLPCIDTIAVYPFDNTTVATALEAGAARVCPLGKIASPPPHSHPDRLPQFSPWVRWIDLG